VQTESPIVARARVAGRARPEEYAWPRLLRQFASLIPPYPGPELVRPPTVPPPPKLDPSAPLPERLRAVASAYSGAVSKRYKRQHALVRRGADPLASKYVFELTEAAEALGERGIAPAAWCAFSVDVWTAAPQGRNLPPVGWVLSEKRIAEREDWFWNESIRYAGGQLCVGEPHRELLRLWSRMRADLLCHTSLDETAVRRLVHRHFPPGRYDVLLDRAQCDARDAQATLDRMVREGRFLW
jgi:hypothetical protein